VNKVLYNNRYCR